MGPSTSIDCRLAQFKMPSKELKGLYVGDFISDNIGAYMGILEKKMETTTL